MRVSTSPLLLSAIRPSEDNEGRKLKLFLIILLRIQVTVDTLHLRLVDRAPTAIGDLHVSTCTVG